MSEGTNDFNKEVSLERSNKKIFLNQLHAERHIPTSPTDKEEERSPRPELSLWSETSGVTCHLTTPAEVQRVSRQRELALPLADPTAHLSFVYFPFFRALTILLV